MFVKQARPKALYLWTVNDVTKWYRRHCGEYPKYVDLFSRVSFPFFFNLE